MVDTSALVMDAALLTGPQKAALVLVQLGREWSAAVLASMTDDEVELIMSEVVTIGRAPEDVVRALQPRVDMLNRAKPSTEHAALTSLDELAPELGEEVRRHLFEFADIVNLDDRAIQQIMRDVALKDVAMALKGATEEVRSKITTNLSTRAAENLTEEIELLGPVRVQQVEEARDIVIRTIRSLEEAGTIIVGRGAEDLVS